MTPDPVLGEAAVAAARATGDPVLISAGLDAASMAAGRAGRVQEAHRFSRERLEHQKLRDVLDRVLTVVFQSVPRLTDPKLCPHAPHRPALLDVPHL